MICSKVDRRFKIKKKIRRKMSGTGNKPRLTVFRSNKHIFAQIIDDIAHKTLLSFSSLNFEDTTKETKMTKIEQANFVGKSLAEKAAENGIKNVVFDRNGYLYHGRVKQLAESARKSGLKF